MVITERGDVSTPPPKPGPMNADTVHMLLNHGADPNLVDKRGISALLLASLLNREQSVAALLANGADPNATNALSLGVAASAGYVGVVKRLLEAGSNVDLRFMPTLRPNHKGLYGTLSWTH